MSREIKFRALCDADDKVSMLYFGMVQFDNGIASWPLPDDISHIDEYLSPLMQFTGLKDISFVDCYEHDIVKAVWSENINDEVFGIGKVVFNCGCFMIEWIDGESNMELLGMIYKTGRPRVFKIIGNIYEGYKCPECHGTGTVPGKTGGNEGIPEADVELVCGECGGTGKVSGKE